ncbi:DUF3499 domain-containing protein [Pseudoglutamicibacter albus]|uniref:DUF3499 domain-containing protein n=1 Tax=Pseudoglutamicibacter albus TaxID=98671 RepID=UPI001EF3FB95|nr:DUF3499 domain-containing protein [Pseudoglutamicibacter albus]
MESQRFCSRPGCRREAYATLTYAYADSTAVLGPLALKVEPHAYDLCHHHADRLSVPLGWELLRLDIPEQRKPLSKDDMYALADALHQEEQRDQEQAERTAPRRTRERLGGENAPPPAKPGLHLVRDDD